MSDKEVLRELKRDEREILTNILFSKKLKIRRRILKAKKFPFTYTFPYVSMGSNTYICRIVARKRSDHSSPIYWAMTTRATRDGYITHTISPNMDGIIYSVHYPHFYHRYSERFLKPKGIKLTRLEVPAMYFMTSYNRAVVDLKHELVKYKGKDVSVMGATEAGLELGETGDGLIHFRTFITQDMMQGEQKIMSTLQSFFSDMLLMDDVEAKQFENYVNFMDNEQE